MANIARFRNGKAEYLMSVNTPEYSSDPDVIVNPNISLVVNVPLKYWKRNGSNIEEMSIEEKVVVDQADLDAQDVVIQNLNIETVVLAKALVRAGLITKVQLVSAIKQVI